MGVRDFGQIQNAIFPAGQPAITVVTRSEDGIMECYGKSPPNEGSVGFAKGCIFKHTDAASPGNYIFVNEGSNTSCTFNALQTSGTAYGTAAGRGPSPAIWQDCPILDFELDPTQGWSWFDDFIKNAPLATNNVAGVALGGGWWGHTSSTAASNILPQLDHSNGEIHLLTTTTDEVALLSNLCGHNTAGYVKFTAGKKTWFEARVAQTNVNDSKIASFVGFAEEGLLGDATLINADQAIVDKDWVGFVQLPADGNAWQTRFNTDTGAGVNGTAVSATADVIVTAVMTKLGIYCDGVTVFFFADGVQLGDSVLLTAGNFPNGEELAFYLGTGSVDGEDCILGVDWVRVAQEI